MVDVVINSRSEKEIINRIEELFRNIISLDDDETSEEINLKNVNWVTPLSILPLAVKITKKMKNNPNLKVIYPTSHVEAYLTPIFAADLCPIITP